MSLTVTERWQERMSRFASRAFPAILFALGILTHPTTGFAQEGASDVCYADVNRDGEVSFSDLTELLSKWGACHVCEADITGDGKVGFDDLTELLSAWGCVSEAPLCGDFVPPGWAPYVVGIYDGDTFLQNGAIVASRGVVTSVTPESPILNAAGPLRVEYGTNVRGEGEFVDVDWMSVHPDMPGDTSVRATVAVIGLQEPVQFGQYVSIASLPSQGSVPPPLVTVSGWLSDLDWMASETMTIQGVYGTYYADPGCALGPGADGAPVLAGGLLHGLIQRPMDREGGAEIEIVRLSVFRDWIRMHWEGCC